MTLTTFQLGALETNCYILEGDDRHAVLVDPAARGEQLADWLAGRGLTLDAVFLTHLHFDHIGGLRALTERTGAPVYLHPADLAIREQMAHGKLTETLPYPDRLTAAGTEFTFYHTPGHSPGSVCIRAGEFFFTGDTLFAECCGRTDLPGGSAREMRDSLRLLASLTGECAVLPGHGESSKLAHEQQFNPYLLEAVQE